MKQLNLKENREDVNNKWCNNYIVRSKEVMYKIAAVVIGFYMIYLGIDGIITGNVSALGGTVSTTGGPVNSNETPIRFIITVMIKIGIGCWLIYVAIFNRNDNDENE